MATEKETVIGPPKFTLFPVGRMLPDFHWAAWAAAWLGIFNGLLWLFIDPNIPEPVQGSIQLQQALLMVPFVLFAVGTWNRRRWAAWGLIALAAIDLVAYFIIAGSMAPLTQNMFPPYAIVLVLFVGPGADVLILASSSLLLSSTNATNHQ